MSDAGQPKRTKPCPICGKKRSEEFEPFCSARCRDRDLANWFNDGYALPGPAVSPEDIVESDD